MIESSDAIRNQLVALAGAHDQTVRTEIIHLLFASEAKRRNVSETEAFRLWAIDHMDKSDA